MFYPHPAKTKRKNKVITAKRKNKVITAKSLQTKSSQQSHHNKVITKSSQSVNKMENNELEQKLISIQSKVDQENKAFAKTDFAIKLDHHNSLSPILKERDDFIRESDSTSFWERAAANFPPFLELLPPDDEFSLACIEAVHCFYEEDFYCGVEITLSRNEYLNNRRLRKRFSLVDNASESTELKIKKETECTLFDFFRDSDFDLEVFDVLYELYVNAAYYYSISEETD